MDDQWEIHCGRVDAVVEQSLGDVQRGNAGLLVQAVERHDELMHARAGIRHVVGILKRGHHIVGVQDGVASHVVYAFPSEHGQIGESLTTTRKLP